MRYFQFIQYDQRVAHKRLTRICFIDYRREMALVAEHTDARSGERSILAVGRLSKLHMTPEAEFALVVSDAWHRQGFGEELLRRLVQVARDEKLQRITATILGENAGMQQVARNAGFKLTRSGPEFVAEMDLTRP